MQKLWLKEETKAKQRSRDRDIVEGDRNTAYFHAMANQRRRKTFISSLEGPDGPTSELLEMLDIATGFYKNLFCAEARSGFCLDPNFFSANEKLDSVQNNSLEAPFTEKEVKKVVLDSYLDGALGPDGISFMFYKKNWDIVKNDIMALFQDFYGGKLDIFRLNFAVISLILKEPDATTMKKFRPISLINCIF
jgi:hypothetical protein